MKAEALNDFAHKGEHVAQGATIDLSDAEYNILRGLGRVKKAVPVEAPAAETAEAPAAPETADATPVKAGRGK